MINRISETIAWKIKDANPEETASVEVMKFALVSLLHNTITFFFILTIGALTSHFVDACIVSASFMILRIFAGGTHFESSSLCIVASTVAMAPIPWIAEYVSTAFTLGFTLISFAITAIYAPTNTMKTRIKPAMYPIYKCIALLIVSTNFLIQSPLVAIAFLIQSTSIIHIKRRESK